MADRITEILEAHILLAERQLELMFHGTDFSLVAGETGILTTEQDLLERIAALEGALAKHLERMRYAKGS